MKQKNLNKWGFAAPSIMTLASILIWLCFDEPKISLWWCFAPVIVQIAMIMLLFLAIVILWTFRKRN